MFLPGYSLGRYQRCAFGVRIALCWLGIVVWMRTSAEALKLVGEGAGGSLSPAFLSIGDGSQ